MLPQMPPFFRAVEGTVETAWWTENIVRGDGVASLLPTTFDAYVRVCQDTEREGEYLPQIAEKLFSCIGWVTRPETYCEMAIWEGFNIPRPPEAPFVKLPNSHGYWLSRAKLGDLYQWLVSRAYPPADRVYTPNFLLPEGRDWMIAADFNRTTLFVGGEQRLIDGLAQVAGLGAVTASLSDDRR